MKKEIKKKMEKKIEDFFEKYDHLWFLPDFDSFSYTEDEIISLFKILFEKEKEFDFVNPIYYRIDEQFCGKWNVDEHGDPKLNNTKEILLKLGDSIPCQYIDSVVVFTTKEENLGVEYAKGSVSTSEDDFYGVVIFPKKINKN